MGPEAGRCREDLLQRKGFATEWSGNRGMNGRSLRYARVVTLADLDTAPQQRGSGKLSEIH